MKIGKKSKLKTSPLVNPYWAILATLPALISIFFLAMLPSLVNLGISFTNYHGVNQPFEFVGFDNFMASVVKHTYVFGVRSVYSTTLVVRCCPNIGKKIKIQFVF